MDFRILICITALILVTVLGIVLLWFCGGQENLFLPSSVLNGVKEMTAVLAELAFCGRKQNEEPTPMSLLGTQSLCSWVSV